MITMAEVERAIQLVGSKVREYGYFDPVPAGGKKLVGVEFLYLDDIDDWKPVCSSSGIRKGEECGDFIDFGFLYRRAVPVGDGYELVPMCELGGQPPAHNEVEFFDERTDSWFPLSNRSRTTMLEYYIQTPYICAFRRRVAKEEIASDAPTNTTAPLPGRWIPVSKELPRSGRFVPVVVSGWTRPSIAARLEGRASWYFADCCSPGESNSVTHWLEVPADPRGENAHRGYWSA